MKLGLLYEVEKLQPWDEDSHWNTSAASLEIELKPAAQQFLRAGRRRSE